MSDRKVVSISRNDVATDEELLNSMFEESDTRTDPNLEWRSEVAHCAFDCKGTLRFP